MVPLKILFLVQCFPMVIQTFFINQISVLKDYGHDVTILSLRQGTKKKHDLDQYDWSSKLFYTVLPKECNNFDIIYASLGELTPVAMDLKKRGVKGELVVGLHGSDASSVFRKNPHCYDELFDKVSLFLPACDHFAQRLIKHGCPPNKIAVLHATIDTKLFTFKEHVPNLDGSVGLITVARLVKKKGLEYAIRAVARLMRENSKLSYTIVGHGNMQSKLQKLIDDLGMHDRIILVGYQPYDRVVQFLDASHIFVLPSITTEGGGEEATPNSIKEAFATGLPVVATYHAGISELVQDDVSGYLVPEKNVDALTDRLGYLIAHPELWDRMAYAGYQKVLSDYEKHKENKKLIAFLYSIVLQHGQ
ncbi:glycosyltransferase [Candidatus Dependentiae bacterium]|nr:glycosyltransferase [Candidatus Dependentiae bacterium]